MEKLVPENTHPARLRLGLLKWSVVSEVEEAGPVPVLGGLFCYYPLVCRGLFSVPVLCFFYSFLFCFTPPCVCDSVGISALEMVRHRYCCDCCELSVSGAWRLPIKPCWCETSELNGFNFPLVCMWTGVVEEWMWMLSANAFRDNRGCRFLLFCRSVPVVAPSGFK